MTNRELQEELKKFPDDMDMLIAVQNNSTKAWIWGKIIKLRKDALSSTKILWIDGQL